MQRFGELPAMLAIRDALPFSLIGLAAGIALFFFASYWSGAPLPLAKRYAGSLLPGFGLMSVCLAGILPLHLARRLSLRAPLLIAAGMTAFLLSPPSARIVDVESYLRAIGASGLFSAIVIAFAAAFLFVLARRALRISSQSWLPDAVGAVVVSGIAAALFLQHLSLGDAVVALIHPIGLLGDTYVALLVITVVEMLLWTGGVHGPALLAGIVTPVYLVLQQQNTAAYYDHAPLPHIVVVSLFLFVFPGGAGATLPLVVMLFFSRVDRLRKIARLTVLPSIVNINEPLLFGLPIVLNPFLALPFVLAPAVLATITYAAVNYGLVSRPAFYYPSSIPSVISTYLATLDWRAAVLVCINMLVAAAVYLPFFRAYERHEAAK
ncbi:MAG: PTS transporter subunit EIIC [Candidatus Eremiobacteraeota bacterium]|nr:PTS transporter subunit EIIC [Candidatus Eremiobacteraeota bacterium]